MSKGNTNENFDENFDVKDFLEKLNKIYEYILNNSQIQQHKIYKALKDAFNEEIKKIMRELKREPFNKDRGLHKELEKYGLTGKQGILKKKLFDYLYDSFSNNPNEKNMKKLLNLANSTLGSLSKISVIGHFFDMLKEFKDCTESFMDTVTLEERNGNHKK